MHRPGTSTTTLPLAFGSAAARADGSSLNATPSLRRRMLLARGFERASSQYPMTPFNAAGNASQPGRVLRSASQGSSSDSTVSTVALTTCVTPCGVA